MKKLRLKKQVIESLESQKTEMILGGERTTTYGDSGGTLCVSCKFCQTEKTIEPIPESHGCSTSYMICC